LEKIAFAARMHDLGGDVVRNMFLLTENPDIISFAGGYAFSGRIACKTAPRNS